VANQQLGSEVNRKSRGQVKNSLLAPCNDAKCWLRASGEIMAAATYGKHPLQPGSFHAKWNIGSVSCMSLLSPKHSQANRIVLWTVVFVNFSHY